MNVRFPTLLHFAAYNGLSDLCGCLLDFPGSFSAFVTYNKDGKNPAEMATDAGHQELAEFLEMFMETEAAISDMEEVYEEMIGHSLYYNDKSKDSPAYMEPIPEERYATGGIASFIGRDKFQDTQGGITESISLQSERDARQKKKPVLPPPSGAKVKQISTPFERPKPPASLPALGPSPEEFIGMNIPADPNVFNKYRDEGGPELQFQFPPSPMGQTLDELKDIQEGFKRGEFNLDEVQQLYAAWKDRNREGTSSMKERQKQLQDLRQRHADILKKATKGKKQSQIKGLKLQSKGSKQEEDEPIKIEHISSSNLQVASSKPSRRPSDGSLKQQRFSTTSTSSSSSFSSTSSGMRDSTEMSDEEGNNYEPVVRRTGSGISLGQELRRSQIGTIEEEPPPPPPRSAVSRQYPKAPVVLPRKTSK